MKKILLTSSIILLASSGSFAQCANPVNIYSFTYGTHSYEVVKELKSFTKKPVGAYCNTPVLVGFGISNAKQAKQVISYGADGVVIGSAIIKILSRDRSAYLPKLKKFIQSFKQQPFLG